MKKQYTVFILFTLFCQQVFSQVPQVSWTLNSPLNGTTTYDYKARDYILLEDGFAYEPADDVNHFSAEIDAHLVFPVDYEANPILVDERVLDKTLPVGTTVGSQNVNLSGAATYQIPIVVPPGTAGMEPNLAIVYSSQAGNGLLGMGWKISGLSVITRVGKTYYHDDDKSGVNLDMNDRFALDGNRLMSVNGVAYGSNGCIYYTEMFNGMKVTSLGTAGGGPQSFKVETKDGKTLEYGLTANSRVKPGTTVIVWMIEKITDSYGNYVKYFYKDYDGQKMISKIEYTANDNVQLGSYNNVEFYYSERDDKNTLYIGGESFKQNILLDKFIIRAENEIVKTYYLKYNFDFYSKLNEIFETDNKGNQYNPIVINYESQTDEEYTDVIYGPSPDFLPRYFLDFTGDGKTDKLVADFHNNKIDIYKRGDDLLDEFLYTGGLMGYCNKILSGDFNGDGLDDFIQVAERPSIDEVKFNYSISNSGGFDVFPLTGLYADYNGTMRYFITDINGNGLDELLIISNNYGNNSSHLLSVFELEFGNNIVKIVQAQFNYDINEEKIYIGDFNGDNKTDILLIYQNEDNCDIYSYENNYFQSIYSGGFPTNNHDIYVGDFNGDMKSDLLTKNDTDGWVLSYSNGLGFTPSDNPLPSFDKIHVGDYNGDHVDDICSSLISHEDNGNGTDYNYDVFLNLTLYYGTNCGFLNYSGKSYKSLIVSNVIIYGVLYFKMYYINNHVDFNGDGREDMFFRSGVDLENVTGERGFPREIFINKDNNSMLVNKISNGFNQKTAFFYQPLTNSNVYQKYSGFYSTSGGKGYDFMEPVYVVSKSSVENGLSGVNTINSYLYKGARIHNMGKGLLDFQGIDNKVSSLSNNVETVLSRKIFANDNPEPFFNFVNMGSMEYSGSTHVSNTTNKFEYFTDYGDEKSLVFFPYLSKKVTYDILKDQLTTTDSIYDMWGNNTLSITDFDGVGSNTIASSFLRPQGTWCKAVPYHTTITKTRNGEDDYTREVDYYYNNNGSLIGQYMDPGKPKSVENYYTYDDYGNVLSELKAASGLESRRYTYTYDSKGRFKTKITNPLGHEIKSTYDPNFGQTISVTDQNGLVSSYEYDGFGQLTKTINPDGSYSKVKIDWFREAKVNILYYTSALIYSLGSTTYEEGICSYFDILGRERMTSSGTTVEGKRIFNETIYNTNGMVEKTSEPYLEGDTPVWNYYSYDDLNRIDYIDYPAYQIDYQYSGATSTVFKKTTGGTVLSFSEKTIDPMGLLTSAKDDGGTILYTYESSGEPKEVNIGSVVITMSYDEYGNQVTLKDPDAGLSSSGYNAFGEFSRYEDANGNAFEMVYDMLGRIKSKTCITGSSIGTTSTYVYDTKPHGKGMISSVEAPNHIGYGYEYDVLSRLSKETESIENETFVTSYTYDGLSRLKTMTYPSGYTINQSYENGHLISIYDDDEVLNRTQTTNARGQIEQRINGSTITNKEYDVYGFPTKIKTTSNLGGGLATLNQELNYQFTPSTGNLYFRKDIKNGLSEYFLQYDALNRIKYSAVNSQPTTVIRYDDNGNIDSRNDVGDYIYDQADKPHAVRKIENPVIKNAFLVQDISYTAFNKVAQISLPELDRRISFTYGPDDARKKTEEFANGELIRTKFFVGNHYEQIIDERGNKKELNYVNGPDGLTAIVVVDKLATPVIQYFYIHQDYLGSYHTIVDRDANILETLSFDAWGNRRNPIDGSYNNLPTSFLFDRGFTGHEHLDKFNVINMNGRVYAPVIGRFLSPDPIVAALESSQSFNRYSYANNNPLVYTDPDGKSPIYSQYGVFLGTDDEGINGMPIIMSENNFSQGMGHIEAWKYDLGEDILKTNGTFDTYLNHYNGLSNRPDFDGFVTAEEGIAWAIDHPNALDNPTSDNTLYINTALLDFGSTAASDFTNGVGKSSPINLLNPSNMVNAQLNEDLYNTVYALGRVDMILLNLNDRTVKILNNNATDYDWNTGGTFIRSTLINLERGTQGLNNTHGFKVYYYGIGIIN